MDEILWHRWGNQAANRENKLHPIGRGGSGLLKKIKRLGSGVMGQAFEFIVFDLPAQMSRFSSFFELEAEVSGDDPGFRVGVFLPFRVIFHEEEDIHRIAGELCAGFLHGPGTPPFGIEAM